jgi:hypothetical protein
MERLLPEPEITRELMVSSARRPLPAFFHVPTIEGDAGA